MINDAPQEFYFNGEKFIGAISGQTERKALEVGGFDEEPELTLVIAIRDEYGALTMPALPVIGESIRIGTNTYRVDRTEIDQFNAGFQMDLRSKSR
jgi:hypothetical protein